MVAAAALVVRAVAAVAWEATAEEEAERSLADTAAAS